MTFAPVDTFKLRMFEKTVLSVCTLAVIKFEDTRLARVVTDNWVTFAPVDTLRLRRFEKTALRVWTLAVTKFEETKAAAKITKQISVK